MYTDSKQTGDGKMEETETKDKEKKKQKAKEGGTVKGETKAQAAPVLSDQGGNINGHLYNIIL